MIYGIFYTVLTGLAWAAVGVCLTFARRAKCHVEHFYVVASFLAALMVAAYQLVTKTIIPPEWSWLVFGCMIASAVFNGLSNICTMLNLGFGGSAAIYFALGRIGFCISFLWSVLVWGEKITFLNAIGILCFIAAVVMTAFGNNPQQQTEQPEKLCHKRLLLSIGSSFCSGLSQICIIFPFSAGFSSVQLPPLTKTLILLITNCLCFGAIIFCRNYQAKSDMKPLIKSGTAWAIFAICSYVCLFAALKYLGEIGRSGIAYPIGAAVQIFVFAILARIIWKEKLSLLQLIALVTIVLGIIAVRL